MNILVTGGAGFIGSHLIKNLIYKGNNVFCLDNFDPFYSKEIKLKNISSFVDLNSFTLIEGDLRDKKLILGIFETHQINAVIHLAAKAGVRPSIESPEDYYDVNVVGTLNLLQAMRKFDVKKLIFASSSSVYGNNIKVPYSETDSVDNPISPYASTKKSGELLIHTFHHLYNFDVLALRFFTVYGPRQRPDLAIHKFFNLLSEDRPIEIYGDGETSRDYTYIDDIVSGIQLSLDYLIKNSGTYEILNIGNSNPVKLSELISQIEDVSSKKFKRLNLPMQQGDVNKTFADIKKASQLIGYSPKTTLKSGLEKFKQWHEKTN